MVERGPEGREGQVGREGTAGREGIPGAIGATGASGVQGDVGEVGETGDIGKTGAKGSRGLPGSFLIVGDKAFLALVLVFVGTLTAFVYFIGQNRDLARQGAESHRAHCIQRAALDHEIRETADFLRQTPDPIILTLPRAVFEDGLAQDRETRRLLSVLDCSDVDVRPPVQP